ncbi:hypothetical protein KAK06_16385 [Ideonella sp. 4Y11]|uniref:Uncharacterized protein n=1 Tax=Ideonella aquatica TaxID=2824119 RepID=A0A940YR95_9BURK|nr:hypothetical protein [Ideonella aquatica]MBQ0960533.1 hypothetical protein [Ideonella aquatica]
MMALAIHGRGVKEAQAGASLMVLAVSLIPLLQLLSTLGELACQLLLPVRLRARCWAACWAPRSWTRWKC